MWRSVAFAALEALLARGDTAMVDEWVAVLERRGVLAAIVDSLSRADTDNGSSSSSSSSSSMHGSGAPRAALEALLIAPAVDVVALTALYGFESRVCFDLRR